MSSMEDFSVVNGVLEHYNGKDSHVIIPDGVTAIGAMAFNRCTFMQSVTIPNSVTIIETRAFYWCDSLETVTIPFGVTAIGSNAFSECHVLQAVTIPGSVTTIGESAFSDCYNLQSVTSLGSITTVERSTFYECYKLESITIPEGVTSIGESAFSGCHNLQSISIPQSVTTVGNAAFSECWGLADEHGLVIVNDVLFGYCGTESRIVIPDGIKLISDEAFSERGSLQSIMIPNSVTTIGTKAFRQCNALQSITIPDSVSTIGEMAFIWCAGLQSVIIGGGVSDIGYSVFSGCSNLQTVIIPESVTTIGNQAFSGCTSLETVTIRGSVTTIGTDAFYGCSNLQSVRIPDEFLIPPKCFPDHVQFVVSNPETYFKTDKRRSIEFVGKDTQLTPEDMAYIWLFQSGKKWKDLVKLRMTVPAEVLHWFTQIYRENASLPAPRAKDLEAYLDYYADQIDISLIHTFCQDMCEVCPDVGKKLKKYIARISPAEEVAVHPIESLVNHCYAEPTEHRDAVLKVVKNGIPYADGSGTSTKKAVVVFLERYMAEWIRCSSLTEGAMGSRRDLNNVSAFSKPIEADQIAAALDRNALSAFLMKELLGASYRNYLLPFACWATDEDAAAVIAQINYRKKGNAKERYWADNTREALYLCDTPAVPVYMEKDKACSLERYLRMRGVSVQEYRDKHTLPHWCMDDAGMIRSAFGRLGYVLTSKFALRPVELNGGKELRSVSAKTDPDAAQEFKDLKKQVADFYKKRNEYIRSIYIAAEKLTLQHWLETYLGNPILRPVAEKVIWCDGTGETFMPVDGAVRTADGTSYEPKDFVQIAHVLDMTANQIEAWQHYLRDSGKKLLIEQVWEPIAAIKDVNLCEHMVLSKEDRNEFKRVLERKAIAIRSENDYSEFDHRAYKYVYSDTATMYVGTSLRIRTVFNKDTEETALESISCRTSKMSRELNTVLYELGRACVRSAIRRHADDLFSAAMRAAYTPAQIAEFLTLAGECENTQATAALLEYREKHFPTFDPMAEFTLD